MKWFITQSIWTILLSFLLGLVLAWLWFRYRYRAVERSWSSADGSPAGLSGSARGDTASRTLVGSGAARVPEARRVSSAASGAGPVASAGASTAGGVATSGTVEAGGSDELGRLRAELAEARARHEQELTRLRADHETTLAAATAAAGTSGAVGTEATRLGIAGRAAADSADAGASMDLASVNTDLSSAKAELASVSAELASAKADLASAKADLSSQSSMIGERDRSLAALRAELDAKTSALRAAEAEHTRLQGLVGDADTGRAELARATADHETKLGQLRAEHEAAVAELGRRHEQSVAALRAEHEQQVSTLVSSHDQELRAKTGDLTSLTEERERTEADLRHRAETAEGELAKVRRELDDARTERDALAAQRDGAAADLAGARAEVDGVRDELSTTRLDHDATMSRLASVEGEHQALQAAHGALQGEHQALQSAHGLLQAQGDVTTPSPVPRHLSDPMAATAAGLGVAAVASSAVGATATPAGEASGDDLERIEGVGPAFRRALNADGIHTFAQVRDADEERLRAALARAGLSFSPSVGSWSKQAGLLAAGDHEGHAALTRELVAGRTSDAAGSEVARAGLDPLGDDAPDVASDDLERIEGIGPRIAASLQAVGIRTFRRLAVAPQDRLRGALQQAGLNYAPSLPTWSDQAALLAAGDEAGFQALVDRLIAGREAR